MSQQIIAVGGGGFSTESEPGIDEYILRQAAVDQPKIGFIGTASGDAARYILRFYTRFSALDCDPSHLDLFRRTPSISDWVNDQDVIFVGGGNTKSMLAIWETWDMQDHLRSALGKGVVLAGISAGAICWFDSGVTDSIAGDLTAMKCLGFLKGSCCPHYSLEADRKPSYRRMVKDGAIESGYAIDDGACIHFVDGIAHRVVSGTDAATAYAVSSKDGELIEKAISDVEVLSVA
jgi:dipeptidase E|tara:strand:- start:295 stop:996 length:702 start_codon:yes stop_codon:yes gene_type:complete